MSDFQALINWYPGHMAKARRLLLDQLKRVDLVMEVCDARLPYSSRNPELSTLASRRKHLLILNKSDLADPETTTAWLRFFRERHLDACQINSQNLRGKELISAIQRATGDQVARALDKGVRKTVRAIIVGIPNVGKSTLINRLYGRNITRIGDRPGVTRSNQWVKISPYLELLDTPGLLWPRLEDQTAARRLCYIGSVSDDVVDLTDLTIHLLEDLCAIVPERIAERYHLDSAGLKGANLLDAVCAGRGWLLKGGRYDYDRCCSVVLDEFRAGKLGRITLEKPEESQQEKKNDDEPDGTGGTADCL